MECPSKLSYQPSQLPQSYTCFPGDCQVISLASTRGKLSAELKVYTDSATIYNKSKNNTNLVAEEKVTPEQGREIAANLLLFRGAKAANYGTSFPVRRGSLRNPAFPSRRQCMSIVLCPPMHFTMYRRMHVGFLFCAGRVGDQGLYPGTSRSSSDVP